MKKLLFGILILISTASFSQTILTVTPADGSTISVSDRIPVSATLDKTAYAVVFSVDPVGETKVLKGKNKNSGAAVTFPSSDGDYKKFSITVILNTELAPGAHTLRIDVYGIGFKDLVDTQEITFYTN